MIVINDKKDKMEETSDMTSKMALEDLFRKEIDAYCAYKEWLDDTLDDILEMGLEEIMFDEYLHAKFLRDYMIDKNMYTLAESDPHEKKFWKIHKHLVQN